MAKVVTIRVVIDDDRVEEFTDKLDSREILEFAVDSVVETHDLPKFIADTIVEGKYEPGDFNKHLNVYVPHVDVHKHPYKIWDLYTMEDVDEPIPYKYDTLPTLTDVAEIVFAESAPKK